MKKTIAKSDAFGTRDKFGYMMGDFGCNMSFQLIGTYAMIYYTQGMRLSLVHWSIIVIIAKIFDAINDPIIGSLVDKRKSSKNGKFRPWIFYGSFAILLTTVLFFIDIRAMSYGLRFAYCLITYCLWSVAYTSANVPYGSLNAVLTDDVAERASLSSLRSIGAAIAMLPVMLILPKIVYGKKDAATGIQPIVPERFVWIALVMGVCGLFGFMLTYFLTRERMAPPKREEKYEFKKALKAFLKNRPVIGICLASFAQLAFFMSMLTLAQYTFQVYFKDAEKISLASIVMMAPTVVFIPFVKNMTKKFGKKEISTWPMLAAAILLVIMLVIDIPATKAGMWTFMILMGIANAGSAFFMLTTWSFVADAVDYQELQTNRREEGTVYSIYSFVRKIGQAVCQGLTALLLAGIGFDTNNVVNTSDAVAKNVFNLTIIFPLIGAVLMFLSLKFVYNLDKNATLELSAAIKEKHKNDN